MNRVRLPVLSSVTGSIDRDGHRPRIVPADVRGRFTRARTFVFMILIAVWAALPWISIHGKPAVFLDVEARKFFLFGFTFNAQDTWLVFFLASGAAFTLVFATAMLGRAWCGWACPQTVFLEGIYRRVERLIEGPREARLRSVSGVRSAVRSARAVAKHLAFLVISVAVAHLVLSYFVSIPRAWAMVHKSPAAHPEAFVWVVAITLLLYGNFAWFREQMCLVLCPYGRLQSVLFDDDSLTVGYDTLRGEPRGKKGKVTGDCVDCNRCVVVCPTGIDIRNGLQLDCIACAQCIDACDGVMTKLGRARGLVRYDSQNGFAGKNKRIVRPRLYLYSAMGIVGATVATFALSHRTDFEITVTRLRGAPYTITGGEVRNALDVHIVNKRGETAPYEVRLEASDRISVVMPQSHIDVKGLGDAHVAAFLSMRTEDYQTDVPVKVHVVRAGSNPPDEITSVITFLGAKK